MFNGIKDKAIAFAKARIELMTLELNEKIAGVVATIVPIVIMVVLGFFFLVFGSVTLSLYLNEVLDSIWQGFGIVTAFYLLLLIIIIILSKSESFKKKLIDKMLSTMVKPEK